MALTDNLKGQWDVNTRGRSDNALYEHVNGVVTTNVNGPTTVSGDSGATGMQYDGTNDYSTAAMPAGLSGQFFDSPFTIAVRCSWPDNAGGQKNILYAGQGFGNNSLQLAVSGVNSSILTYLADDNGSPAWYGSTLTAPSFDTEHVIVFKFHGGTTCTNWVDGVQKNINTTAWNPASTTLNNVDRFSFGAFNFNGGPTSNWFNGRIFWAAVWDRALTTEEIESLDDVVNPFVSADPEITFDDTTLTPGQTVTVTASPAFSSNMTTMTFPNGATITAEAGASGSSAEFIMPSLSTFQLEGTHAQTPWSTDLSVEVTDGTLTATGTLQIVAPSASQQYSGLTGTTPYPGDTRLPTGTLENARYFAEYTAGEGTFNEYGVASQSVLPAILSVRIFQSGSWSQIDTYNFALTDTTPSAFSIPDLDGVELSTAYTSVSVTPAGYNTTTTISITGGEYSINGGPFTSITATISPGDSFRVRATSSAAYNTGVTSVVTIGGVASSFVLTTKSISLDVEPISFTDQTNVARSAPVESNSITPTGFNSAVPISVINGEYSINNGAYTNVTGTINPGDSVKVRVTSSSDFNISSTALLTVGDQTASFSAITQAAILTPNPFTFPAKTGIAIGTSAVTSDPIAVTGINSTVNVFISGSSSAEYSINEGAWTSVAGSAQAGDIIRVRVNASDAYDTLTSASLTVGGVTSTFTVRTVSEVQAVAGGLKVKLETVESGYLTTGLLNDNFQKTQDTINDKILFRENPDGTPNEMKNNLDMNSYRIINLPEAGAVHEPVTLGQALELLGGDNIAISGYANKSLVWVKGNDNGNWSPILTFDDVEACFIQAGIVIAKKTVRGILDPNTGNINATVISNFGQETTLGVTNNNTPNPVVTVTHVDSGVVVPIVMFSVQGGNKGNDGEDGTDGTDGTDGVATLQYYIKPINGTAIKNGTGTLTIEARALGATSDELLSSGNIKLYVGDTLVTSGNGYASGSDGYTGVFDAGDINDSVVVLLKDIVAGLTYDSITLVDIQDGVASNATVGSIAPSNGLGWSRAKNGGAWAPVQAYTDLVCTFYQGGSAIATETRRVTLNTSTGALTEALQGSNDANIDVTVSGSTTAALNLLFTHTPSGIQVAETVHSVLSGNDGTDGADGADGADGENASLYYIKAVDGTAIKNGVGSITVEAHKIDGTSDALLSSGTIKLYVGTTEVTVANGYASGSNGYTGVFDSGDINDSVVVSLKNGPSGTVYDTITLVDIIDGIGSNATTGSINTTNGLAWVRAANAGAWSPGTTTTDLVATFYQGGVAIATETQRVTLNTTAGTLTSAQVGVNHSDISVDVSGSGTPAITVVFTHVPSGAKVAEQVMAVQGGAQGSQGTPGTPGVNGVFYYIKPTAGTAIKNGVGNLTVEAHRVDGTSDTTLSSGTIKLYVGTTEVTTGNGYQAGSTGYVGVFGPSNINEKVTVLLKNGPNGTVLDSISLIDVEDGTGSNATYGSITPSGSLAWLKPTGAAWTPANTTLDLACIFYQGGVSVAGETRRVTLNTSNGTLTSALTGSDDSNVTVTTTGSGTQVLTVTFTHVPSGAKVSETVLSVMGTGSATQRALATGNLIGEASTSFVTAGGPVSLRVTGTLAGNGNVSGGTLSMLIKRDGTTLQTINIPVTNSTLPLGGGIWTASPTPLFDVTISAAQSAGTYTFSVDTTGLSSAVTETFAPITLEVIEITNG